MSRLYRGWIMVLIALLANAILVGVGFASFGLFVIPVGEEFGLSRAEVNIGMIAMNVGIAVASPAAGRLLDLMPLRRLLMACSCLLGASLVGLGLSHSIWLDLALLTLAMPFALQGAGLLSMGVLLVRWFTVQRGRAMVIAYIGASVGMVVVPPVVTLLIGIAGWRAALVSCGIGAACLLLALFAFVREAPAADEHETGREAASAAQAPIPTAPAATAARRPMRALVADPVFWIVALTAGCAVAIAQALQVSLVPLGAAKGMTPLAAASLVSAFGVGTMVGMVSAMLFGDRFDRVAVLSGMFLALALACGGLLLGQSRAALLAACAIGGFASCCSPIYQALCADRFGANSFGTIRGLMVPIMTAIAAVFVHIAGETYDRTGGYNLMLYLFIGVQVISAGVIATVWLMNVPLEPEAPVMEATTSPNGVSGDA